MPDSNSPASLFHYIFEKKNIKIFYTHIKIIHTFTLDLVLYARHLRANNEKGIGCKSRTDALL